MCILKEKKNNHRYKIFKYFYCFLEKDNADLFLKTFIMYKQTVKKSLDLRL